MLSEMEAVSYTHLDVYKRQDIFEDLGADSLDVVELVMSIEEEYDIVITDERAGNVRTCLLYTSRCV